jgi:hypothetical protein
MVINKIKRKSAMSIDVPEQRGLIWRKPEDSLLSASKIIKQYSTFLFDETPLPVLEASLLFEEYEDASCRALGLGMLNDGWEMGVSELEDFEKHQVYRTLMFCTDNDRLSNLGHIRSLPKRELLKIEGIGPYRVEVLCAFGRKVIRGITLDTVDQQ